MMCRKGRSLSCREGKILVAMRRGNADDDIQRAKDDGMMDTTLQGTMVYMVGRVMTDAQSMTSQCWIASKPMCSAMVGLLLTCWQSAVPAFAIRRRWVYI